MDIIAAIILFIPLWRIGSRLWSIAWNLKVICQTLQVMEKK